MESSLDRQLATLVDDSRRMLARAQEGDWSEVSQLEARRRHLIQRIFSRQLAPREGARLVTVIKQVIETDRRTTELGKRTRRQRLEELGLVQRNRRAVRQYDIHSRTGTISARGAGPAGQDATKG